MGGENPYNRGEGTSMLQFSSKCQEGKKKRDTSGRPPNSRGGKRRGEGDAVASERHWKEAK